MKRLLVLFTVLLGLALPMWGQTTAVTATITDSDAQTWNNGTYTIIFVPLQGTPANSYRINGATFTQNFSGSLSSAGVLTVTLTDTNLMTPQGGQWSFNICPNASAACGTIVTTIVGATCTTTCSTVLSSGIRAPRFSAGPSAYGYADVEVSVNPPPGGTYFNVTSLTQRVWNGTAWTAGGGGGTSPTQPAFLVTASPFNAKCDGSTDDFIGMQAAITAAQSTSAGGAVILPSGACAKSAALSITAGNVSLIGQGPTGGTGRGSTLIDLNGSNDCIDVTGISGTNIQNVKLQDFTCQRNVAPTGSSIGISLSFVTRPILNNVEVFDAVTCFSLNPTGSTNAGVAEGILWNEHCYASAGRTVTTGFFFNGQMNSTRVFHPKVLHVGGTICNEFKMASGTADLFITEPETNGSNNSAGCSQIFFQGNAEDVHIIHPILDLCGGTALPCIDFENGTSGVFGVQNNVQISDPWLNVSSNHFIQTIQINNTIGITVTGGYIGVAPQGQGINITGASSKLNTINGPNINIVNTGSGTYGAIISASATSNVVENMNMNAPNAGTVGCIGISAASNNAVLNITCTGPLTNSFLFDATSNNNTFQGSKCIGAPTVCVSDSGSGNTKNFYDSGTCTMAAGTCTAQTLTSHTYGTAPACTLTWTGGGALAGILRVASTTTTVTPSSTNGADTAVVNYYCSGN
jgi:hypothetical protein